MLACDGKQWNTPIQLCTLTTILRCFFAAELDVEMERISYEHANVLLQHCGQTLRLLVFFVSTIGEVMTLV